ncbi:MAG: 50S ribosomal protein L29 [Nitrosomonas sp.]|jgi:large subunit ribosomal protein L29|nr:50S ribosomal protein L29 [Nitrosomonas sp.]MBK7364205.1 50S ribosomal protein L29 [Nitrosomonas sp.]
MNQSNLETKDELNELLASSLVINFKLRIQKATQQLKDLSKIKLSRREIARIKTKLQAR